MTKSETNVGSKTKPPVRLRKPDRLQAVMAVSCPDQLAGPAHQVRAVAALVQTMDLTLSSTSADFRRLIQSRQAGPAGSR